MTERCRSTNFSNGFVYRLHNRRVHATRTKAGNWHIQFVRAVNTDSIEEKDKEQFDLVIQRTKWTVLVADIMLSDESFEQLAARYMHFTNKVAKVITVNP